MCKEIKVLHIGDKASLTKTFTEEDIMKFAELTLDYNGMHTNEEIAKKGIFRRPVVHGVFVGSLISSVMGTVLPGDGAVIRNQDISYEAPIYPGDTVTANVTLTEIEEHGKYYIATLEGTCHNQDGVLLVKASSREMLLKRFFEVRESRKE